MKVKLLRDIEDIGTKDSPDEVVGLKIAKRRDRYVTLTEGRTVECSDETGKKWIEKGWAEAATEEEDE